MRIDIETALQELCAKNRNEIEEESALIWAARAGAAYTLYLERGLTKYLLEGEGYYAESLEHSGASESPQLTFNITHVLFSLRCRALRAAHAL